MELKRGYKHTEVGVIPEEWEAVRLDDCMNLLTDFEANGSFERVAQRVRVYDTENFAWYVRATDLENDTSLSGVRYVDQASYRFLKKTSLLGNEVLITKRGEIGKVYLFQKRSEYATLAPNLYLLKLNNKVLPAFVFAYFKYGNGNRMLRNINASTTLGALYKNDVKAVMLPRPPLPEQRAIAEALSDVDVLLGALHRLITKKRDLKQAAMQQLLTGQTRLPGFHGEWEVKRVLKLGEVVTGGTPRTDVQAFWGDGGDGYPWITPTDISTDRDMFTSERTLTQKGLNAIRALPANTVLVTCIASIGKNAILKTAGGCNQQINAVTPNKKNSTEFLYYVFEASKQYLLANAGTTATSIISKAAFEQLIFKVPPFPEQTAIAEVLTDMDAELAALEQRREKTRALKQAMMQKLLTGRTRLI